MEEKVLSSVHPFPRLTKPWCTPRMRPPFKYTWRPSLKVLVAWGKGVGIIVAGRRPMNNIFQGFNTRITSPKLRTIRGWCTICCVIKWRFSRCLQQKYSAQGMIKGLNICTSLFFFIWWRTYPLTCLTLSMSIFFESPGLLVALKIFIMLHRSTNSCRGKEFIKLSIN